MQEKREGKKKKAKPFSKTGPSIAREISVTKWQNRSRNEPTGRRAANSPRVHETCHAVWFNSPRPRDPLFFSSSCSFSLSLSLPPARSPLFRIFRRTRKTDGGQAALFQDKQSDRPAVRCLRKQRKVDAVLSHIYEGKTRQHLIQYSSGRRRIFNDVTRAVVNSADELFVEASVQRAQSAKKRWRR